MNFHKLLVKVTLLLVLIGATFIYGCGGNNSSKENPSSDPIDSQFVVVTNTNDQMLLSQKLPNGDTAEYFGSRDVNGAPELIQQVQVNMGGEKIRYSIDSNGRPTKIVVNDEQVFDFSWESDTKANLSISTFDNKFSSSGQMSLSQESRAPEIPFKEIYNAARLKYASLLPTYQYVDIKVTNCGLPSKANDIVDLYVIDNANNRLGSYPGERYSAGSYKARVPYGLATTLDPSAACSTVLDALGAACAFNEINGSFSTSFCYATTSILASSIAGAPYAIPFLAACETSAFGLTFYCGTGMGKGLEDEKFCENAIFKDTAITEDINMQAQVAAFPEKMKSDFVLVRPNSQLPPFTVELQKDLTKCIDHIKVTTNKSKVTIKDTANLTATAYADEEEKIVVPSVPTDYTWEVTSGGGTVDSNGVFKAGEISEIVTISVLHRSLTEPTTIDLIVKNEILIPDPSLFLFPVASKNTWDKGLTYYDLTHYVGNPYDYVKKIGLDTTKIFQPCESDCFSDSGSKFFPATNIVGSEISYYDQYIQGQINNGIITITNNMTTKHPPPIFQAKEVKSYNGSLKLTLVYNINTGDYKISFRGNQSISYILDSEGNIWSGNATDIGDTSGTWPTVTMSPD